ncbi:MAG: nickel pincer cofactor biosynthesis protein LarC [Candidatus Jordarchaeales archaeon]
MSIAIADSSIAGVSGDMFLGALVDLCGEWSELEELASVLPKVVNKCSEAEVRVEKVRRKDIAATKVSLFVKEEKGFTGKELLDFVEKTAQELSLSKRALNMATSIAFLLAKSEAKVHGENVEEVHLHELGSADTIFDIVGAALMCEKLGLLDAKWFTSPVAVGCGVIRSSHGSLPIPAPATVEILREAGMTMLAGLSNCELATPTGVAILAALKAEPFSVMPPVTPIKAGYGAGERDLADLPNVFRVIIGNTSSLYEEEMVVVETNVDDISGEVIAHVSALLLKSGARDVTIIPTIAKKGRPGCILQVICTPENYTSIAEKLIKETGTLGVRLHQVKRLILEKEMITFDLEVEGKRYPINVKVARDKQGRVLRVKPEFEDLRKVSEATGKSVRELLGEFERCFLPRRKVGENV